jgi:hypothetical protein
MARIFIEGFECGSGTPPGWILGHTMSYVSAATYGMSGSYAWQPTHLQAYIKKSFVTSYSEMYVSFKLYVPTSTAMSVCGFGDSAGTAIGGLCFSDGQFKFSTGLWSTILGASGKTYQSLTTHQIEIWYRPLNASGRVQVKINDELVIDYTGDSTSGLENIQSFWLGYGLQAVPPYAATTSVYDDVVADDADWIGNSCIQPILITGAGASAQWDPSDGLADNYEMVQEVPANDTNYITTNTTNDVDTYAMSNMTGDIAQINAVRIISRGLYEGSPTPTELKHVVRMGGTDYPGVDVHPPLTAGYVESLLLTRPTDSEPWEEADINGMEVGVIAVA